jgi:hypothetical protein
MRLLAPVMVLLGVLGAAPAAAQLVTLRQHPGPSLAQGPVLVGEQTVWSEVGCLRGCGPLSFSGTDSLYEIRMAGGGETGTLFRARQVRASSGPSFIHRTFSFLASEAQLVTLASTSTGDEAEGEARRVVVRAGAPGTGRSVLVDCSAEYFGGEAPIALDGSRLAYDPDPCDGVPRLVVRDLVTGATTELPEPAGGGLIDLRGRFAAWIASLGGEPRLVVHDLMAGTTAYSAPSPGVTALDLDADGTVAAVSGMPRRPCATGRLLRYSVAAPAPADLGPACATGVAIDAGRIFFLGWDGPARTLRALTPAGAVEDLVRFGRVRPGAFDVEGERLAWAARACTGDAAIFAGTMAEAPYDAGSINCRARLSPGAVPVRRGVATIRLTCPRGCAGELGLRHAARRQFSLMPGEREVRIRLWRRVRERLERRGSLEALAKAATFNRAGERRVDRRAVTLVAR